MHVDIIISPDGSEVSLEGIDFQGQSCADIEEKLTQALGSVVSEEKKPEFYNSAKSTERERVR